MSQSRVACRHENFSDRHPSTTTSRVYADSCSVKSAMAPSTAEDLPWPSAESKLIKHASSESASTPASNFLLSATTPEFTLLPRLRSARFSDWLLQELQISNFSTCAVPFFCAAFSGNFNVYTDGSVWARRSAHDENQGRRDSAASA